MAAEDVSRIGAEEIPMPFLEISHSAKMGTVVGSIDLARITDQAKPEAALLAGTIPQAHRGIVFVDEINRLAEVAPELADVLLSVMGTKPGRIQIEETGLPVIEMPVSVSVWAASNPDEEPGPLEDVRRQLSDRFDLMVNMARPTSVAQVISILRKDGGHDRGAEAGFSSRIATGLAAQTRVSAEIEELMAHVYLDFGLESIRAIESLLQGARLRALLAGRGEVSLQDVLDVAPLALRHRVDVAVLNQILTYVQGLSQKAQVAGQASTQEPPKGDDQKASKSHERARTPDGRGTEDPLTRLLCRLKDAFSQHGQKTAPGRAMAGNGNGPGADDQETGSTKHPAAQRGSSGRSTPASIVDPMKAALVAPGAEATPIYLLATHDLVHSPEDLLR
jgi:magnesium chelatase subunit I